MPKVRIEDGDLQHAASGYARQIANHAGKDNQDIGVIVILVKPRGDGTNILTCSATVAGKPMPGPQARRIFRDLHNETSVVHAAPYDAPEPQ